MRDATPCKVLAWRNWISLTKKFLIIERVNLQFRSQFFNILNRTNFNTPQSRGLHFGDRRPIADRRSDYLHHNQLSPNPVRTEATLVVERSYFPHPANAMSSPPRS
jgi:hypothetical protein